MNTRSDLCYDLLSIIKSGSLEEVKEALIPYLETRSKKFRRTMYRNDAEVKLLLSAIDRSDEERVDIFKFLLQKCCHINNRSLRYPSEKQDKQIVQLLKKNGCRINRRLLCYAIKKQDKQIVQLLLENDASLNDLYDNTVATDALTLTDATVFDFVMTLVDHDIFDFVMKLDFPKRLTPIHVACMKGDMNVIEFFINYGVSEINSPAWRNYTPLHLAVMYKQKEAIKLLITRGANINTKDTSRRTPLDRAIKLGKETGDWTICDFLLRELPYREDLNRYGTALHAAVKYKRKDTITYLLSCKEDSISVKNQSGSTPLHMAYYDFNKEKCYDTVHLLMSVNVFRENPKSNDGLTHFHIACWKQNPKCVRQLLDNGASITDKYGKYGLTPLYFAIYQLTPNEEIIDMILKEHEKICENPVDGYGLSHFHIACSRNLPQVVSKFLKTGVNVNQKVSDNGQKYAGYTPLQIALVNRCADVVSLLLKNRKRKHSTMPEIINGKIIKL